MGIFERAQETGFLDLDGFEGPGEAFFAAQVLQENWRRYCEEHDRPVLVLGAGFGGKGRCHIEFSCPNREALAAIVGQRQFAVRTEPELTELTEGSWVSEQMPRDEALSMVAQVLEDFALLRWHKSQPPN